MLRSLQFLLFGSLRNNPVQLLVNTRFDLFGCVVASCFRANVEEGRIFRLCVLRRHERYALVPFNKALIQARGLALRKHQVQYLKSVTIGRSDLRCVICKSDSWYLRTPLDIQTFLSALGRFYGCDSWGIGTSMDRGKLLGDLVENTISIEVSCQYQRGVTGVVVLAIVCLLFRTRRALDILKPADNRIAIRVDFVGRGVQFLEQ